MFACGDADAPKKKQNPRNWEKQEQDHKEQDEVSMTNEKSCRR